MSDVTAQSGRKPVPPHAETGWAQARRPRNRGVRTCLPALLDRASAHGRDGEEPDTIVRGED
ncbi:hypothetical protein NX794_30125 [Streptomyces sp. LP11]|uniref:Uncharacterized protein n=1 Tax=Streptomyces pyxinicus TaxID=2970331 RepID=A0ABT2BA91_9ACTN|nr:hypothetical protein [Streptomyces sp. LP11]MCS0605429.1 hypothetical protein [Streptomyces sp. LP11]